MLKGHFKVRIGSFMGLFLLPCIDMVHSIANVLIIGTLVVTVMLLKPESEIKLEFLLTLSVTVCS